MARSSLDRTISKREKVNAVSKASLAMLNPAYAMGIESGLTWLEARESDPYLADSHDYHDATPELEAFADADGDQTESIFAELPIQARTTQGHVHHKSVFDDEDIVAPSPTSSTFSASLSSTSAGTACAGNASRNSTVKLRKNPGRAGANASSNSLSRFFSWKRAQSGSTSLGGIKITRHDDAALTSSMFATLEAQPRSAPSHIESFEAAQSFANLPNGTSSLPTTPLSATLGLPALSNASSSSISSTNSSSPPSSISDLDSQTDERSLGRKHSMPSLREVRSKNACHFGNPSFSTAVNEPFYWREEHFVPGSPSASAAVSQFEERKMPRQDPQGNLSNVSSSNSSGTRSPSMKSSISRISSVGKGAIRKSIAPLQLTDAPYCASPTIASFVSPQFGGIASVGVKSPKLPKSPKSPRSTGSKSRGKRFYPVNSPEMPSLPLGAATLAEAVEQGFFGNNKVASAKAYDPKNASVPKEMSSRQSGAYYSRRRSRSVGALEAESDMRSTRFSSMFGLPEASQELDLEAILAPSSTLSRHPDAIHVSNIAIKESEDDIYGGLEYDQLASGQEKRQREASNGGGETPKLGESSESGNGDDHWDSPSALVARRVQLNHGSNIVGTSSPKLVSLSPRLADSIRHSPRTTFSSRLGPSNSPLANDDSLKRDQGASDLLQPQAVLVNVMPPTPDLSAGEEDTFEGETPSPSVLRTARQEEHPDSDEDSDSDEDEEPHEEAILPSTISESKGLFQREPSSEDRHQKSFSVSATSEASSASSLGLSFEGAMSQDEDEYEPFGFARSLSSSSLASSANSEASDSESAEIMVASSTGATFERATRLGGTSPSSSAAGDSISSMSPSSNAPSPWGSSTTPSTCSLSSGPSSVSSSNSGTNRRVSRVGLSTISSGQSLASVMTTSTSILDFGMDGLGLATYYGEEALSPLNSDKAAKRKSSDLFSPAEIRGLASQAEDEDDCDTPRLSSGTHFESNHATTQLKLAGIQPTRPLQLRKNQQSGNAEAQSSPAMQPKVLSTPSTYRIPRGQSASSPHLELDLSLPLDLDDLGLGLGLPSPRTSASRKLRQQSFTSPPKPPKSAARRRPDHGIQMKRTSSAPEPEVSRRSSVEPKTPPRPSATKLQNPPMGSFEAAFGLGLGLALDVEEDTAKSSSSPPSGVGFAL